MKVITEDQIEQVVQKLGQSPAKYEEAVEAMSELQPELLSYIFSEDFELLTLEEREYLLYLTIVIWQTFADLANDLPMLDGDQIGALEEQNWTTLNAVKQRHFRERIDPFFENYPQEDLLSYIEDALTYDEEDDFITQEGREYLFIAAKTIIDCFDEVA